jgi:hypothetical protein
MHLEDLEKVKKRPIKSSLRRKLIENVRNSKVVKKVRERVRQMRRCRKQPKSSMCRILRLRELLKMNKN